ncbi:MAG: SprB repeat-containing protein, partial [Bacteroidetes bacterium]|nr:SprB repeat-containing protein [Bacteroidota bacterium]
ARDIFIIKFTNTGVRLWATYFGGDGDDFREPLAADKLSNLFVAGEWTTESGALTDVSYPLTDLGSGAFYDATFNGSGFDDDGFVAKFIPPALILTSTVTETTCGCNGSTAITPAGGCSPYKYSWYNGGWTQIGNTQLIGSLCSGNYQIIVNDTVNCVKDTAFVNVPSGVGLTLNSIQNNLLCNGVSNGSVNLTISNSSGPYTYSWNNGTSGSTTSTTISVSGLSAAVYTITVTDGNGCTATVIIPIISPPALIGQFAKGTGNCDGCGCKEWVIITVIGGTNPYTYTWPDGYSNRYKNQLCPGTYTINIKDKNGCGINLNVTTP